MPRRSKTSRGQTSVPPVVRRGTISYELADRILVDARKEKRISLWDVIHSQTRLQKAKDLSEHFKRINGESETVENFPLPKGISPDVAEAAARQTLREFHLSSNKIAGGVVDLMRERAGLLSELADLSFRMKNRNIGEKKFNTDKKNLEAKIETRELELQNLLKKNLFRHIFLTRFAANENVIKSHIVSTAKYARKGILEMERKT